MGIYVNRRGKKKHTSGVKGVFAFVILLMILMLFLYWVGVMDDERTGYTADKLDKQRNEYWHETIKRGRVSKDTDDDESLMRRKLYEKRKSQFGSGSLNDKDKKSKEEKK